MAPDADSASLDGVLTPSARGPQERRHATPELERRFLPLLEKAGFPLPDTQIRVSGWRVDFYISDLGLVFETDSPTWHRTPAQLSRDTKRDHSHLGSGLTPVRFSHAQIFYEPDYVLRVLRRIAKRVITNN